MCDPGYLRWMFSSKDGEASSAVHGERGVRSLETLGSVFRGEALGGRGMDAWGHSEEAHKGGAQASPLSSLPLRPRHAYLLSDSETKSANKGPFQELQAGPQTATKKAIETSSQENCLL